MRIYDSNDMHPSIERLSLLRLKMKNDAIDWIVIYTNDPHLSEYIGPADKVREYYSAFTGSAGTLVVSQNEALLWTDSRYYIQAEEELNGSGILLMKAGTKDVPLINDYLSDNVLNGQTIGLDFKCISISQINELNKIFAGRASICDCSQIIYGCFLNRPDREFKNIEIFGEAFAGMSAEEKIRQLRNNIEKKYCPGEKSYAYVLSDLCSIMWILNIRGADIDFVPVAYSYLLVENNNVTFFCSKDKLDSTLSDYLNKAGVHICDYGCFYDMLECINSDIVYVDAQNNNAAVKECLEKNNSITESDDNLLVIKYIKNQAEIEGMKQAHVADAVAMIKFIRKIKQIVANGDYVNEYQAGKMLDGLRMENHLCEGLSFETICAYGANAAIVHYTAAQDASAAICKKGMLLVDSGGHYAGGTTDITRNIVLGDISEEEKKCYTAVLKANLQLMDAIFREGVRGENLDILARRPIWDIGYDYGHGTGHGIGCKLNVHEDPVRISYAAKSNITFKPGMVVSDEPGIYVRDQFGIRLENALLVLQTDREDMYAFEALTLVPFDRKAIIVEMLTDRERDLLNEYHSRVYNSISLLLDDNEREWLGEECAQI